MSESTKKIPVNEKNWEELSELKESGQSWDEFLEELIEEHKKARLFDMVQEKKENREFTKLEKEYPRDE